MSEFIDQTEIEEEKKKGQKKKNRVFYGLLAVLVLFGVMVFIKLPYYVNMPGSAIDTGSVIEVDQADESEEGQLMFTTVSMARANPLLYLMSFFKDYYELEPIEEVLTPGMSEEQYYQHTLMMMDSSQQSAKIQAYQAAGKEITYENQKLIVYQVVEGMPAKGKLQAGDQILAVDGEQVTQSQELIKRVSKMSEGEEVTLAYKRKDKEQTVKIPVQAFEDEPDRVGLGVQLVTTGDVKVSPEVTFHTEDIGGPSAGLMFTLEMIAQLTSGDLTRGYQIAGTGTMEADGTVGPIGGIDKKVVAADKEGAEIFFAPNEEGAEDSNYQLAAKTAKDIGTDMKVVPIDNLQEALDYLEKLPEK